MKLLDSTELYSVYYSSPNMIDHHYRWIIKYEDEEFVGRAVTEAELYRLVNDKLSMIKRNIKNENEY